MEDKAKKVVFIGSCAFSGSTVMDMLLGASPDCRSLGEIGRAFLPQKKHHILRECGCMNPNCETWESILQNDPSDVHNRIFENFPDRIFIDSTKDPHWINDRSKEILNRGHEVVNILIWKSPNEISKSYKKRGLERYWKRHWTNYHRLYFSLIGDFFIIPYELITKPDKLQSIMKKIGLEINQEFWKADPCILFGNDSAKRHLYPKESDAYRQIQSRRKTDLNISEMESHRSINEAEYSNGQHGEKYSGKVPKVHSFLSTYSVTKYESNPISYPEYGKLRFGLLSRRIRKYFQISKTIIPRIRWEIFNTN